MARVAIAVKSGRGFLHKGIGLSYWFTLPLEDMSEHFVEVG
jgi:hypothetical protein